MILVDLCESDQVCEYILSLFNDCHTVQLTYHSGIRILLRRSYRCYRIARIRPRNTSAIAVAHSRVHSCMRALWLLPRIAEFYSSSNVAGESMVSLNSQSIEGWLVRLLVGRALPATFKLFNKITLRAQRLTECLSLSCDIGGYTLLCHCFFSYLCSHFFIWFTRPVTHGWYPSITLLQVCCWAWYCSALFDLNQMRSPWRDRKWHKVKGLKWLCQTLGPIIVCH